MHNQLTKKKYMRKGTSIDLTRDDCRLVIADLRTIRMDSLWRRIGNEIREECIYIYIFIFKFEFDLISHHLRSSFFFSRRERNMLASPHR